MLIATMMQGSPVPPPTPLPPLPAPVPPSVGPFDARRLASDLNVRVLQAQAREIGQRIQGALAQRQEWVGQLSHATGPQIGTLNAQIGQLDATIAQLQVRLADINDRIAQINVSRRPQIIVPPPRAPSFDMNGRDMAVVSIVFICAILMPITIGIVRRLTRGSPRAAQPVSDPAMNARMDRLEQAMDAIAIEIERISEGQRFVTKVLTQRPAQSPAAPAGKEAAAEPAPFLALGAGPMEPIRAAERQTVRQSITPH